MEDEEKEEQKPRRSSDNRIRRREVATEKWFQKFRFRVSNLKGVRNG